MPIHLTDPLAPIEAELLETLADWDHTAWANWTRHLLNNLTPENIERWKQQIETPYSQLTAYEQELDRKEAQQILALVLPVFKAVLAADRSVRHSDKPSLREIYNSASRETSSPENVCTRGDVINDILDTEEYDPKKLYWVSAQGIEEIID